MSNQLHETAVQSAISTRWLARSYHYLPTVGSTNDRLKEMLAKGSDDDPPAGTVVLADFQNQGRGRLNRSWEAPPGTSLLLSVLFRPYWPAKQAHWLTMAASLAAVEAIKKEANLTVGIKWPNDLMIFVVNEWRKAGGLLLEGSLSANGRLESAILGIGMNVNIPQEQLPDASTPATSLLVAGGRPIPRLALLAGFLQRLEAHYEVAERGKSPQATWVQQLITLGQSVHVTHTGSGQTLSGRAEGTDTWGRLLLRDGAGQLHTIATGDVTLRDRE